MNYINVENLVLKRNWLQIKLEIFKILKIYQLFAHLIAMIFEVGSVFQIQTSLSNYLRYSNYLHNLERKELERKLTSMNLLMEIFHHFIFESFVTNFTLVPCQNRLLAYVCSQSTIFDIVFCTFEVRIIRLQWMFSTACRR